MYKPDWREHIWDICIVFLLLLILILSILVYYEGTKKGQVEETVSVEVVDDRETPEYATKVAPSVHQPNLLQPEVKKQVIVAEEGVSILKGDVRRGVIPSEKVEKIVRKETKVGDVLEELEVHKREESTADTLVADRKALLLEKQLRNKGRDMAGVAEGIFQDAQGNLLNGVDLLPQGVVVVPWFATEEASLEWVREINKVYVNYTGGVNFIFLAKGYEDEQIDLVEKIVLKEGFNFKCYYDVSMTFMAYTKVNTAVHMLFVNADDYIEERIMEKVTDNDVVAALDRLQKSVKK